MERLGLKLAGLSCVACAKAIEQAIALVPGVIESNVNFDLELATVGYDRQATTAEVIIQAVTTAGYQATSIDTLVGVASSRNETLCLRQALPTRWQRLRFAHTERESQFIYIGGD